MSATRLLLAFLLTLLACKKQQKTIPPNNEAYSKAFDFREAGITDSAYFYFNLGKDLFLKDQDYFGAGKCLVNMGIIAEREGDYFGAQENAIEALKYLDPKNPAHHVYLNSNYNNLGLATNDTRDYKKAIEYYQQALKYTPDSNAKWVIATNIGLCHYNRGDIKTALRLTGTLLKKNLDPQIYATALTNYAIFKQKTTTAYDPLPDLLIALKIREKIGSQLDLGWSYDALSEYYALRDVSKAKNYAIKAQKAYELAKNPDARLYVLDKLVRLNEAKESKSFFLRYPTLSDSLQTARNAAKNQFAYIRYETEKQKAANLALQRKNTEKNYQLTLVAVMMAFSVAGGTYWHQKRKKNLLLKAENDIKENRLRISKKVHDVVANGLYRVMSELENSNVLDKEKLVDSLETMYEKSRDISYEQPVATENYHEYVSGLAYSFSNEGTKVLTVGNSVKLWEKVAERIKLELAQVLQEMMVNMTKHSQASSAVLKFAIVKNILTIQYTDNGIGLPGDTIFKNGLTNTGNRIKNLNGNITFDRENQQGLKILMEIPLS